jgi:hypothetical protein
VETFRNDIHSFFYFLLLKAWGTFGQSSDAVMLLSSVAFGVFSVFVIWFVVRDLFGPTAGLWAAALFCLLPTFAWSLSNLRMYSLLPALVVLVWWRNLCFFKQGGTGSEALLLIVAEVLYCHTHAIDLFFLPFIALAAVIETARPFDSRLFRRWVIAQLAVLVMICPMMVSALVRGSEPLPAPSLASLFTFPGALFAFWGAHQGLIVLGQMVFISMAILGLSSREGRIAILTIPIAALVVCILLSMTKPMFKSPVFTANLTPFLVIFSAVAISRGLEAGKAKAAIGLVTLLCSACGITLREYRPSENYRPAAEFVAANVQAGDLVVAPSPSVYWGIARYAIGPDWGEPLAVMPAANAQWASLIRRLPAGLARRLMLEPKTDLITKNGVTYVIGTDIEATQANAGRLFVVHRKAYAERGTEALTLLPSWTVKQSRSFGGELSVEEYERL